MSNGADPSGVPDPGGDDTSGHGGNGEGAGGHGGGAGLSGEGAGGNGGGAGEDSGGADGNGEGAGGNGDGIDGNGEGAGGDRGDGARGTGSEGPAELLGEVRAIRRKARLARHAYWFPLVLFGLLACASVPFYLPPTRSGVYYGPPGPRFLQSFYLGGAGPASFRGTAYYWLGAMLFGVAATVLWYRWRGSRVGLRTPARGYLITGLIILALALLLPWATRYIGGLYVIMPGDLLIRGTFPFVLIGLGLCFLAWAERSVGLTVIAVVYLAVALLASLYDIENVFYDWFGVYLSITESVLPNVLLPALVLLLSGAGAWVVQRRQREPAPEDRAP